MAEKVYKKFNVTHTDGTPCKGRYFVLNLDARSQVEQKRARTAMKAYISEVVKTDPEYALELLRFYTTACELRSVPVSSAANKATAADNAATMTKTENTEHAATDEA